MSRSHLPYAEFLLKKKLCQEKNIHFELGINHRFLEKRSLVISQIYSLDISLHDKSSASM